MKAGRVIALMELLDDLLSEVAHVNCERVGTPRLTEDPCLRCATMEMRNLIASEEALPLRTID